MYKDNPNWPFGRLRKPVKQTRRKRYPEDMPPASF
jgi:hypothetical protein